jgi:hypothetical protein
MAVDEIFYHSFLCVELENIHFNLCLDEMKGVKLCFAICYETEWYFRVCEKESDKCATIVSKMRGILKRIIVYVSNYS